MMVCHCSTPVCHCSTPVDMNRVAGLNVLCVFGYEVKMASGKIKYFPPSDLRRYGNSLFVYGTNIYFNFQFYFC